MPGPVAEPVDLAGHRRQQRLRPRRRPPGEPEAMMVSLPASAPTVPPETGRVEEGVAGSGQPLAQRRRERGRDGAVEDDRGPLGQRPHGLGQRGLGLGGRGDHQRQHVGPVGRLAGAGRGLSAGLREPPGRLGVDVEAAHGVAGAHEVEGHRQPHGAESDEADPPAALAHDRPPPWCPGGSLRARPALASATVRPRRGFRCGSGDRRDRCASPGGSRCRSGAACGSGRSGRCAARCGRAAGPGSRTACRRR